MSPSRRSHMDATASSSSPIANAGTELRSSTFLVSRQDDATSTDGLSHEDYGPQLNFTIWFLVALSSLFLAVRIYCKALRNRGLWWDDHILIASWLALTAQCAFVSVTVTLGLGRPIWDFNFDNLEAFLLYSNFAGSFAILAATWSKTSFAITVLRISNGWMKKFVWFIIISVNVTLGLSLVFTWIQCRPFQKTWQPLIDGECWPKFYVIKYNTFTAAYSGAMDIVLAVIPWRIIWNLTMNKKEKFGVLFAMSMGVLYGHFLSYYAGATSIVKITTIPGIGDTNFTDSNTQLVILGAAESAITIIAASIPILRALLRDSAPGGVFPAQGPSSFMNPYEPSTRIASRNTRGSGITPRGSTMSTDFGLGGSKGRLSRFSVKFDDVMEEGYEKEVDVGRAM